MNKKMALPAQISAVALVTLLSVGCATTKDLERVEAKANAASESAAAAQSTAQSAQSQADAAMRAAEDAQACCRENSEKLDRAFRRSMYK